MLRHLTASRVPLSMSPVCGRWSQRSRAAVSATCAWTSTTTRHASSWSSLCTFLRCFVFLMHLWQQRTTCRGVAGSCGEDPVSVNICTWEAQAREPACATGGGARDCSGAKVDSADTGAARHSSRSLAGSAGQVTMLRNRRLTRSRCCQVAPCSADSVLAAAVGIAVLLLHCSQTAARDSVRQALVAGAITSVRKHGAVCTNGTF